MRLIRLLKYDIAREANEWVNKSIISESQAEQICREYAIDYHRRKDRSLGYNVLVGLGYLFIGVALILLIGNNWDEIPRALRMGGLVLLTLVTQGLAIRRYLVDEQRPVGLFLLGNLFYGAAIILIAQIYHLGEHMPDGIFWWALGCLPFALILNSRIIMLQGLLLALIWLFVEVAMGYYPALFPLFLLAAARVLYRGKTSLLLFLATVGGAGTWLSVALAELWQGTDYNALQAEHVVVNAALFIFAYACSKWLCAQASSKAQDYGVTLGLWCLRFGLLFMLVMSFEGLWAELIRADWNNSLSMFAVAGTLCAATLALSLRLAPSPLVTAMVPLYLLAVAGVVWVGERDLAVVYQVATNIGLVLGGAYLIIQGIRRGLTHYFFLGVTSILLTALLRYFDLIGNYVGGAALFLVFAGVLLAAARFWKRQQPLEVA